MKLHPTRGVELYISATGYLCIRQGDHDENTITLTRYEADWLLKEMAKLLTGERQAEIITLDVETTETDTAE